MVLCTHVAPGIRSSPRSFSRASPVVSICAGTVMALQHSTAPTQWGDAYASDAEAEAALRDIEVTANRSHSVPNRIAVPTAPWPPMFTVPTQLQLQHGNPQSLFPSGLYPAAGLAVPEDNTAGSHIVQPWGTYPWPLSEHPGLSSSSVASMGGLQLAVPTHTCEQRPTPGLLTRPAFNAPWPPA